MMMMNWPVRVRSVCCWFGRVVCEMKTRLFIMEIKTNVERHWGLFVLGYFCVFDIFGRKSRASKKEKLLKISKFVELVV